MKQRPRYIPNSIRELMIRSHVLFHQRQNVYVHMPSVPERVIQLDVINGVTI